MEPKKSLSGTSFKAKPGPLSFIQRFLIRKRLRRWVSTILAPLLRLRHGALSPAIPPTGMYREALRDLFRFGYAPLRMVLCQQQIDEIQTYLKDKTLVSRTDGSLRLGLDARWTSVTVADYLRRDILACPHVLELANHPDLLQLAATYIGCKPTISALLLRWSFPSDAPGAGVQAFHRDADDWRVVRVFVYLTDVDRRAGPHVYVRGSHDTSDNVRQKPWTDDLVERRFGPEMLTVVTGAAGFGFVADTFGLHKGMAPRDRPRLLLEIQYSLLPVYDCEHGPEPYEGSLVLDPYINRLMLLIPSDAPSAQPA